MSSDPPLCRVVTAVTVCVENGAAFSEWRYTTQNKMAKVLTCLRLLDPWDPAETDPLDEPGARYRIELTFSDGSTKGYTQIGTAYLREDNGPWQIISARHAWRIPLLLAAVPSDTD